MTSFETWYCNYCADPPDSDNAFVHEDNAHGWLRVEVKRSYKYETWTHDHTEVMHICPECQDNAECADWLFEQKVTGYYEDDAVMLKALMERQAAL